MYRIIIDILPDPPQIAFITNDMIVNDFCHIPSPIVIETLRFICPTIVEIGFDIALVCIRIWTWFGMITYESIEISG